MPNFNALPETFSLVAKPAPLPKNWHFEASFAPGKPPPKPGTILIYWNVVGGASDLIAPHDLASQDVRTPHGVNRLTYDILSYARMHEFWEKPMTCIAIAAAQGRTGALTLVAKSNLATIQMPVRPLSCQQPFELLFPWGEPLPPVHLMPGQGRRIYYRESPAFVSGGSTPKIGWYIDPQKRFEEVPQVRGLDRFTFWLAVFAIAPRNSMGVTTGEMLADRLGAIVHPIIPASGTMAAIQAANGVSQWTGGVMWTSSRVVMLFPDANPLTKGAYEFGLAGLSRNGSVSNWAAAQDPSETRSFRKLPAMGPLVSYGIDGL